MKETPVQETWNAQNKNECLEDKTDYTIEMGVCQSDPHNKRKQKRNIASNLRASDEPRWKRRKSKTSNLRQRARASPMVFGRTALATVTVGPTWRTLHGFALRTGENHHPPARNVEVFGMPLHQCADGRTGRNGAVLVADPAA